MNRTARACHFTRHSRNENTLPNARRCRTHVHAVYRLRGNACKAEAKQLAKKTPFKRYGKNTARGEASPSTCAAMVTAWLRQRRNTPAHDPCVGGIKGHTQPSRCSRVQRPCPPQPVGRRLMASTRFRTDPAISLWRQAHGFSSDSLQHQGFQDSQTCQLGGKQPETGASANGRGMSERTLLRT